MIRFALENRIDLPVRAVFDAARDIGLHTRSMSRSREEAVAGVTSGLIGPGEWVTWRARHFGMWLTMTSRITEYSPPRRFVDEQVAGPFSRFRHAHLFHEDQGGTRMVDEIEFEAPFGPLGVLAEGLVLARYMRRLIEERNTTLLRELS